MLSVIFAIGSFQSLVISILLLTKKDKKNTDQLLSGFFFVITLYFLNFYSYSFKFWEHYPDILFVTTLIPLCIGPLLYFSVRSFTGQKINTRHKILHTIPLVTVYLVILPFVFHSNTEKSLYYTSKFIELPINIAIGTFLQYLSAPIYFTWIIIDLIKYKEKLKNNFSTIEKHGTNWILKLLVGAISLWMINCIDVFIINFTKVEVNMLISQLAKLPFLVFIIFIGIYGIRQGNVFTPIPPLENKLLIEKPNTEQAEEHTTTIEVSIKEYANSYHLPIQVLSYISDHKFEKRPVQNRKSKECEKDFQNEINILMKCMDEKQVYLNSELRIQDVAVELEVPTHTLSYILNAKLNLTFYDFINQFRVEEAKKRLIDPQFDHLTVLAIAHDCGFNSKATFNRLFKKHTGKTPSQYIKHESHERISN